MAKWIIGSIVVVLAGAGLWYSGMLKTLMTPPVAVQTATTTPSQATEPQPENGMSANNNISDAALSQDTAAIDAQLQGLSADTASVDASMSDKSVQ